MLAKFPLEESMFIASRASSGIMNGGFYRGSDLITVVGLILTLGFSYFSLRRTKKQRKTVKKHNNWLWWVSLIGTLLSISLVFLSFYFPLDIHLFTWLTQSFQTLGMFLNNPHKWWRLLLLVAPSVFLQKLFINLLGGHPWYYQGTNVASGGYYTMLGLKIPRLFNGNMYFRLATSIVSIIILFLENNLKPNE